MKYFSVIRLAVVGAALMGSALPLGAQGFRSFFETLDWSIRGSMLFFPEDNGNASAPMPILPSLGGGVSYSLNDLLALELSLDLYGNTYDYDYGLERVVPANDEFRTSFVIGMLWGLQPVFRFRPRGDAFTIRAYGGLGFDTRIVFRAYGIKDNEEHTNSSGPTGYTIGEASKEITRYFWGGGRWIFPFIGGGMDFDVLDGVLLGFDIRAWFPLWRIWTREGLPPIEGFRFGLGFRVSFG
ncbi:MAG: hypothetical protein LBE02_08480 [Spirochaetaceae bacterium]|jgi:hypothetical protein|nr:hypothetical protein [Spirochaetaceae bacterium]